MAVLYDICVAVVFHALGFTEVWGVFDTCSMRPSLLDCEWKDLSIYPAYPRN